MFKDLFGKTQKSANAQSRFETRKNLKLESLRNWDEISALCGSSFKPDEFKAPKVDMSEAGNGVELAIALPGIAGQDVDIKLDGAVLTLKAQGAHDLSEQGENASRVAHFARSYEHRIQLPFEGDGAGAEATLSSDGALRIFVPRSCGKAAAARIEVRPA